MGTIFFGDVSVAIMVAELRMKSIGMFVPRGLKEILKANIGFLECEINLKRGLVVYTKVALLLA
jgi:hypothetical protein